MLLEPDGWTLVPRIGDVLAGLPGSVAGHASAETHACAIEVATRPHRTVAGAVGELAELRLALARSLERQGTRAAGGGTHPSIVWTDVEVSSDARHRIIDDSMRGLARREPTFALHVHVGVPDPGRAVRALDGLREHLPLLLALAANSPYWQGRGTGLASTRTSVFGAFPRTGIPRRFDSYEDWVQTVGTLLRSGAFPEPTFLWWDVRPQPAFGTVEVRVMDAQTDLDATAGLVALVQSLARLEIEDGFVSETLVEASEVLEENRFIAARDGIEADLLDPVAELRRPARAQLRRLLDAVRPHADALGCRDDLERVIGLALAPAFQQQIDAADRRGGDLVGVTEELAAAFAPRV